MTARKKTKNAGARRARATLKAGGRRDEVADLMRRPGGVTTAQIQKLTGMQQHSARALISSITVGKDEKIIKTKEDGATVYSIVAKTRAAA